MGQQQANEDEAARETTNNHFHRIYLRLVVTVRNIFLSLLQLSRKGEEGYSRVRWGFLVNAVLRNTLLLGGASRGSRSSHGSPALLTILAITRDK
jgi:hypothetical protein